MDLLIFLFFVAFFILPALKGKNKRPKAKIKTPVWTPSKGPDHMYDDIDDDDPVNEPSNVWRSKDHAPEALEEIKARIKTISVNQAKQYAAYKEGKRLPAEEHYHDPITPDPPAGDSKDADDRNRRRRSDWGERAGPEVLSTRNVLIVVFFGLVLTLLANTLPS